MDDVNWWLLALAFVLGVVLTFAMTVRRVRRGAADGEETQPPQGKET